MPELFTVASARSSSTEGRYGDEAGAAGAAERVPSSRCTIFYFTAFSSLAMVCVFTSLYERLVWWERRRAV